MKNVEKMSLLLFIIGMLIVGILYILPKNHYMTIIFIFLYSVFFFILIVKSRLDLDISKRLSIRDFLIQRRQVLIPLVILIMIDVCMTIYFIYITGKAVEADSRIGFLLSLPHGYILFIIVDFGANIILPILISYFIVTNLESKDNSERVLYLGIEKTIWVYFLSFALAGFINNVWGVICLNN